MCFFWRKKIRNGNQDDENEIELVKLVTVHNSYELGVAESILKENKIPYIVQEDGGGGFLRVATGALLTNADIMVEKSYTEKAKELTYMLFGEETAED